MMHSLWNEVNHEQNNNKNTKTKTSTHKSMNKPNKRIKFAKRLGISGLLESQLFCCTLYNHQSTDWLLFEIIHIQTLIDVAFFFRCCCCWFGQSFPF